MHHSVRRYDFYSNVNISTAMEESMLNMKIILDTKILTELDLNCNSVFYKIYLVIGTE